jgi:outer membrane protein
MKFSKTFVVAVIVIALYTASMSTFNFLRTQRVGYINNSVLLDKYPGALKARGELTKQTDEWKKNIEVLEGELNQLNQEILQNAGRWGQQTLAAKQDTIKRKQTEYARYSRAISEKASHTENELFQPVYAELNAKITDFGKAKGYDIILGTVSGGNILYAHEATDLTEKFLAYAQAKN